MKKIMFSATILALLGLLIVTTQVLASPPVFAGPKNDSTHTPGPRMNGQGNQGTSLGNVNSQGKANSQSNTHSQGKHANYRGSISAVSASSLTISQDDGFSVNFALNSDTRIKIPTMGRSATVAALKTGMQINVLAMQDAGGVLTARMVLVVPGKPALVHRVGAVTDYQPGISITIKALDGNSYTFLLSPDTKILPAERASQLAVGVRVTIIAPRDVAGGTQTAQGIVIHPS
jgi:hypothetical protein